VVIIAGLSGAIGIARAEAGSLPEGTPLRNIGEAVLHIKKDILILSNKARVAFKNGVIVPDYSEGSYPMCSIELRSAGRKARVLKADARDIQLTGETGNDVCHNGACWVHLLADTGDKTVHSILCADLMDHGQNITLKMLQDAFGQYLTVEFPEPGHGLY
jgi:hypothetical protein